MSVWHTHVHVSLLWKPNPTVQIRAALGPKTQEVGSQLVQVVPPANNKFLILINWLSQDKSITIHPNSGGSYKANELHCVAFGQKRILTAAKEHEHLRRSLHLRSEWNRCLQPRSPWRALTGTTDLLPPAFSVLYSISSCDSQQRSLWHWRPLNRPQSRVSLASPSTDGHQPHLRVSVPRALLLQVRSRHKLLHNNHKSSAVRNVALGPAPDLLSRNLLCK